MGGEGSSYYIYVFRYALSDGNNSNSKRPLALLSTYAFILHIHRCYTGQLIAVSLLRTRRAPLSGLPVILLLVCYDLYCFDVTIDMVRWMTMNVASTYIR